MITEIPSVMISGVDAEDRDADPVDEPDRRPTPRASAMASAAPWVPKRETMNAAAVAVVATERSTPPVSMTSVCPAAIRPSTAA